jgi:hypothetical protein
VETKFIVSKLISGGQTGADRGGLDVAIELGIPYGGKCPKGRKAEDGAIPARYKLDEMSSAYYKKRTEHNVIESNATLIFTIGKPTGGTKLTVDYAVKHNKPFYIADLASPDDNNIAGHICGWMENMNGGLNAVNVKKIPDNPIVNIAGPRESKFPGIQERVKKILLIVFSGKVYPKGSE